VNFWSTIWAKRNFEALYLHNGARQMHGHNKPHIANHWLSGDESNGPMTDNVNREK